MRYVVCADITLHNRLLVTANSKSEAKEIAASSLFACIEESPLRQEDVLVIGEAVKTVRVVKAKRFKGTRTDLYYDDDTYDEEYEEYAEDEDDDDGEDESEYYYSPPDEYYSD